MAARHPVNKSLAAPLALLYAALIVHASLFPFSGWRDQGLWPWWFVSSPWPRYWTGFDVASNWLGYMPLGGLLTLAWQRRGTGSLAALALAGLLSGLLSLSMETLQGYLPQRVPSNLDLALNTAGGLSGAAVVLLLGRLGVLAWLRRWQSRWIDGDARGALVLLLLWPLALLSPAAVPFGLGQVAERVESALAVWLRDTPFIDWMPLREFELQPMLPLSEMLCVALGLLVPLLLGYQVLRVSLRRAVYLGGLISVGVLVSALSAALRYSPEHAWAWLGVPALAGLGFAVLLGVLLLWTPPRLCLALLLLTAGVQLTLLNQAAEGAYFAQTLQSWEQGRFIRFYGVIQWLGWLWPYATLLHALVLLALPGGKTRMRG